MSLAGGLAQSFGPRHLVALIDDGTDLIKLYINGPTENDALTHFPGP